MSLSLAPATLRAAIDNSVTQAAWRMANGVTAAQVADANWMTQDSDMDGQSNGHECAAGTNPFVGNSIVAISNIAVSGGVVEVTFPTVAGKRYFLQKNTNLPNTGGWTTIITALIIGDGNPRTVNAAISPKCFYRILVQDYDADGDSVADYAEQLLHFNPHSANSGGSGSPSDLAVITAALSQPNAVTVTPDDPAASEDGLKPGMIMVRRTGSFDPLTIPIAVTGSATPGADYETLPATVSLPIGVNSATLYVMPMADNLAEGGEVVTVTPAAAPEYTLNGPAKSSVLIADSTQPTGTGLLGQYFDTANTIYTNAANFNPAQLKVTRVDPTVDFSLLYGTPNGAVLSAANSADNYSVVWEGYLTPTAAGSYSFQLDADDKARVFLDLNDGAGLRQIVEHGWDGPATVGTFKQSAAYNLAVPAAPANQYRMRVEYVETSGDARCRLQWRAGIAAYASISSANVRSHTQAVTYAYTRFANSTGTIVVTPSGGHAVAVNDQVELAFSSGNLFMPSSYSGTFTVTAVTATTFTVAVAPAFPSSGSGSGFLINSASTTAGWLARYYPNPTFAASPTLARVDTAVTNGNNGVWGAGTPDPLIGADTFSVRWTGQVQPQYSEEYSFVVNCDDSAKLFINGQQLTLLRADTNAVIDWPTNSTTVDRYARISLLAGQRYDIKLEYLESTGAATCRLFWYSLSQPKQIIPQARLYPTTVPAAPAVVMSPAEATALVGGPFSYKIQANNGGSLSATGLPPWLSLSNGLISGTPPIGAQGSYQIVITVANAAGTSQSVLNLDVSDTGRSITREYWNGISGTSVASIPVGSAPSGTDSLSSLSVPADFGDDYGVRIFGYLTTPATGNYYFWIAGSDAAELWISNDDEPVNKVKRASVLGGTPAQAWNGEANQKSPWLALEAGRKYYLEVLLKAGVGAGDSVAVGWLKPGETGDAPSEIVPGYVLSDYVPPATTSTPGTLYVATMLSQGGAVTSGVGTSTLRVSEDETSAIMTYSYSGLTGPIQSQHIHLDPYLNHATDIVFDIDAPETQGDGLQPDGSYKWTIAPRGTLSVDDIREAIKQGKAYINLHTALYPNGEIRGNYTAAGGSRTFSVPPPPAAWADDHTNDAAATRFLTQATFGPNVADITALKTITVAPFATGYEAWIEDQFAKPASLQLPEVFARQLTSYQTPFDETLTFNAWWKNSIGGEDQLRQRVAFALSEILVVSGKGPLADNARALSYFYDLLAENAFGNFRDILEKVTYSPSMGRYLDALRNDKPDQSLGRIPNENYAREIKQLFSIGLFRTWPDGTLILNSKDQLVPTYTQTEIVGFAHVFTGLDYGYDGAYRTTLGAATDWTRQMREVPARHFTGKKRVLNNEVLPGLATVAGQPLDPYAVHVAAQYNDPAYQALPAQELAAAHDQLFQHPNIGPYICRQLIQRLVMSHPPRDYLYRVVQKFNDNGAGVRGEMGAVIKAILLDYDARSPVAIAKPDAGKQREAVMRVAAAARAFRTQPVSGTYAQNGTRTVTIDTTTPHRLTNGNSVFLEFADAAPAGTPLPSSGIYSVASITGSQNTSTRYTVNLSEWLTGTYNQAANSTTVTVSISSHWLDLGLKTSLKCTTGPGVGVLDGLQTVTSYYSGSTNAFTFTAAGAAPTTARTGSCMIPRFTSSLQVSNSGLAEPYNRRITMNTNRDHNFAVGDGVSLNFNSGTPIPIDGNFTVDTVVDRDTITVLGSAAANNLTNQQGNTVYVFPHLPQPLVRNGAVNARASTYAMGSTDGDISQTPLFAPTVFNFYPPDYKFPGTLASQGLTTPEFQDTSDTNVVRQANFMWNGVMNPGNTNGISSFKSGGNALVMDFGPWLGNATNLGLGAGPSPTVPWTNDQNIGALIDRMNTLLLGGQLPLSGKAIIQSFITANTGTNAYTNIAYNNTAPSDSNKRDRMRAVIHFLISSADFNIQR